MIKLRNVSYVYMQGGPFEKIALDNINLEIDRGEFIGIIGHTGSGQVNAYTDAERTFKAELREY